MRNSSSKPVAVLITVLAFINMAGVSGQSEQENPLPHFLFPSFRQGVIVMKDGKAVSAMLNYNMLEQKMITEYNGTYRYSGDPDLVDTIFIEDRIFVPVNRIFYEIISAGRVTFYVQNRVTFTPQGQEVGYGMKSQTVGPTRYKRYESSRLYGEVVYLDPPSNGELKTASVFGVGSGSGLKKFTNARQLMKILPEFRQEIQNYIATEKVNFRSAADIALLGDYLNQIAAGK